mgnify:CR=1 FL=1
MYSQPSLSIWDLPRSQLVVRRIVEDTKKGICFWILFPPWIDINGFQLLLLDQFERDALSVVLLDLSSSDDPTPMAVLRNSFTDLSKHQYLEQMVDNSTLPDAILLSHLEECSIEQQKSWAKAMQRWAEACRSSGSNHTIILISPATISKSIELPPKDIRLTYHLWAGIPSILETRLLCRTSLDTLDAESNWREYLLASIAGTDMKLAEFLWESIIDNIEEVKKHLITYAEMQGWTAAKIRQELNAWRPKLSNQIDNLNPKDKSFSLVGDGITLLSPEYGEEIHSAALALLGKHDEIRHRLWRAQVSLILPIIDEIRIRIFTATKIKNDFDSDFDSDALEWGSLSNRLKELPDVNLDKNQWMQTVSYAWIIRNKLAHYEIIDYRCFKHLWYLYGHVRDNILTSGFV